MQIKFGDDFLTPITTDGQGWANVSYTVPLDQKLGPVTVQFIFSDNPGAFLVGTISNLTNIEVRSNTVLTIDSPILANPVAGETFNITGTITSDNGSNLTTLQGNALSALVDVRINGGTTGFSTSNGTVQEDSTWKVTITLDNNFARGTHTTMQVSHPPQTAFITLDPQMMTPLTREDFLDCDLLNLLKIMDSHR